MSPLRTASVFNEISSDEVLLICFCILKGDLKIVHLFKVVISILTTVAYAVVNSITLHCRHMNKSVSSDLYCYTIYFSKYE